MIYIQFNEKYTYIQFLLNTKYKGKLSNKKFFLIFHYAAGVKLLITFSICETIYFFMYIMLYKIKYDSNNFYRILRIKALDQWWIMGVAWGWKLPSLFWRINVSPPPRAVKFPLEEKCFNSTLFLISEINKLKNS